MSPKAEHTREVLNARGAASLLGVHEKTVRNWAADGLLPARKVGKRWFFARDVLIAWAGGDDTYRLSHS
jgi:excisionase family DNA binding protein